MENRSANLAHDDIVLLGRAADVFGYGLGPGTTLGHDQATNIAYGISTVCDSWRSGGFDQFLHATFCPAYYAAGN